MALQPGLSVTTLFGGAMLLLGSVVLVASGRYVWRATAVFRATGRNVLAEADAGTLVRVSGAITRDRDDALVAPFSETDCVALRYRIEERRLGPLFPVPWYATVHEATGAVPFDVRTAEGTTPIVGPVQTVTLATQVVATTGPGAGPPARISDFEEESSRVPASTVWRDPPAVVAPLFRALSIGTRRYSEQRAAPDDTVTVVGRVTSDGSGIDPLVVSDRSPAGTVFRMTRTSLGGLLGGTTGLALGYFLLFVA